METSTMILPSNEETRWNEEETQRSAKNANLCLPAFERNGALAVDSSK